MRIPDPVACSPSQAATPLAAPERPERPAAQAGPALHQVLPERTSSSRAPAAPLSGAPAGKMAPVRHSATLSIPAAWAGGTGDDPGARVAAVSGAVRTGAGQPEHAAPSVAAAAARTAPSQATGTADPPAPPAKPPPEPPAPARPRRRDTTTALLWALLIWAAVVLAVLLAQAFSSSAPQAGWDDAAEAIAVPPPREKPQEAPGPR